MAIIVVEGIDRVGKTTLVNKLFGEFQIDPWMKFDVFKHDESYISYDQMDSDNEADKMSQLITMVDMLHGNVIFDRFHVSDFVYGVVDRGYKFSNAHKNMLAIDWTLSDMQSCMVYVKPKDLLWSSKEHGSSLKMHNRMMEAAMDETEMHLVETDFDSIIDEDKFVDLVKEIRSALEVD